MSAVPHIYQLGRRYLRMASHLPVTLLADFDGKRVHHASWLLDLSTWGVRVRVNFTPKPGTMVEVIPNGGPKYPIRGRVVWVGKAGSPEEGQAGLEFISPCPTSFWFAGPQPRGI